MRPNYAPSSKRTKPGKSIAQLSQEQGRWPKKLKLWKMIKLPFSYFSYGWHIVFLSRREKCESIAQTFSMARFRNSRAFSFGMNAETMNWMGVPKGIAPRAPATRTRRTSVIFEFFSDFNLCRRTWMHILIEEHVSYKSLVMYISFLEKRMVPPDLLNHLKNEFIDALGLIVLFANLKALVCPGHEHESPRNW